MAVFGIPLNPAPSQEMAVQLGGQSCRIKVRQRRTGLFVDLRVQDVPIGLGALATDRRFIIRAPYSPFVGDLFFVDTQGTANPEFSGLGSRWLLAWDSDAWR